MFRERLARIDWRRDAVLWGRLLAVAVAVLGAVYAAMEAWDLDDFGESTQVRYFISALLGVLWYSTLILIVTELVARLRDEESLSAWGVTGMVRVLGGAIIVAGLLVSIWSVVEDRDEQGLSGAEYVRYVLLIMVHTYLWQGALLILLASVVDYIGWRSAEELPDEEEASIVVTEP